MALDTLRSYLRPLRLEGPFELPPIFCWNLSEYFLPVDEIGLLLIDLEPDVNSWFCALLKFFVEFVPLFCYRKWSWRAVGRWLRPWTAPLLPSWYFALLPCTERPPPTFNVLLFFLLCEFSWKRFSLPFRRIMLLTPSLAPWFTEPPSVTCCEDSRSYPPI